MTPPRRMLRSGLIVAFAAASVFAVFQLTSAGSLSPSTSPGGTMHTAEDIHSSLVGTSYDSSSIATSSSGSALQISKCIIAHLANHPCP